MRSLSCTYLLTGDRVTLQLCCRKANYFLIKQAATCYPQTTTRIITALLITVASVCLKGRCIEFQYYADGIHSGLTPPG